MTLEKINEKHRKDEILFFDKKSLQEPLSRKSKLLMHMADIDPENPGLKNINFLIKFKIMYFYI